MTRTLETRGGARHSGTAALDPRPLAEWLAALLERESYDELADRLQITPRRIYALTHGESRTVREGMVDELLCREGGTHLRELYPEQYGD